jgi:hypothetical protein
MSELFIVAAVMLAVWLAYVAVIIVDTARGGRMV